jgi:hypothetical protein
LELTEPSIPITVGASQTDRTAKTKIRDARTWTGDLQCVTALNSTAQSISLTLPLSALRARIIFYLDIDLKKAAKQFATKFATGSSVKANAAGEDEIVVQGDVADEILDMIVDGVGVLKGIPEDNVEIIEEKKKKGD